MESEREQKELESLQRAIAEAMEEAAYSMQESALPPPLPLYQPRARSPVAGMRGLPSPPPAYEEELAIAPVRPLPVSPRRLRSRYALRMRAASPPVRRRRSPSPIPAPPPRAPVVTALESLARPPPRLSHRQRPSDGGYDGAAVYSPRPSSSCGCARKR